MHYGGALDLRIIARGGGGNDTSGDMSASIRQETCHVDHNDQVEEGKPNKWHIFRRKCSRPVWRWHGPNLLPAGAPACVGRHGRRSVPLDSCKATRAGFTSQMSYTSQFHKQANRPKLIRTRFPDAAERTKNLRRYTEHRASYVDMEFGRVEGRVELQNRPSKLGETTASKHQLLRVSAKDLDVRSVDTGVSQQSGHHSSKQHLTVCVDTHDLEGLWGRDLFEVQKRAGKIHKVRQDMADKRQQTTL